MFAEYSERCEDRTRTTRRAASATASHLTTISVGASACGICISDGHSERCIVDSGSLFGRAASKERDEYGALQNLPTLSQTLAQDRARYHQGKTAFQKSNRLLCYHAALARAHQFQAARATTGGLL